MSGPAIAVRRVPVAVDDGTSLELSIFESEASGAATGTCLLLPAMGVRASYYDGFAGCLAAAGVPTATVDLRGLGRSSVRASRRTNFGYHEMIELDIPAAVAVLRAECPGPVGFVGHSLGGQLACLATAVRPELASGIVLVASCSVYYRSFGMPKGLGVFVLQHTATGLASLLGWFPGHRLGFADREARRLVADWSRQGRTGRYEVEGSPRDLEALLEQVETPVLAVSFTDDAFVAPGAVEHLLGKMPRAERRHDRLTPADLDVERVGHFSWVHLGASLAPRLAEWLGMRDLGAVG